MTAEEILNSLIGRRSGQYDDDGNFDTVQAVAATLNPALICYALEIAHLNGMAETAAHISVEAGNNCAKVRANQEAIARLVSELVWNKGRSEGDDRD